ncbi:MAG: DUF1501 domain-containing protein [Bdellovibrionales bacterium]|nr:DUF1501 domain-containing protein [Bdellovibrionales bacterium]
MNSKLTLHRRNFLKAAGLLCLYSSGLLPILNFKQAMAQSGDFPHFFVLIQMEDGWDVTLSLDPKDHSDGSSQEDIFIEYQKDQILKNGQLSLGPAASALTPHSQDILVINGIEMRRDAGHETNRDIMSSGYGDGKTAVFPVELAATYDAGPMGILIERSISLGERTAIVTDLSSLTTSDSSGQNPFSDLLNVDDGSSFAQAQADLIEADKLMPQFLKAVATAQQAGITDNKHLKLAAAFMSGSAQQAALTFNSLNLDTHSNHEGVHMSGQSSGWASVAELFSGFKKLEYADGLSLFDLTTFYVVSEFSRTPFLNGGRGKDHNPHANSVLLAGRGIQGGKNIGKSFVIKRKESNTGIAQHVSRPIDFKTGQVVNKAPDSFDHVKLIFPEDLAATIGALFKSPKGFYEEKKKGLVIPGVLS